METFADISKKNRTQLLKDLDTTRKSLFDIRYKVANKQAKGSHEIKNLKKTVAQILTALQTASKEPQGESKEALETEVKKADNAGASTRAKTSAGSRPQKTKKVSKK